MEQLVGYLKKNWFKVALALLLGYIAWKKDLSFRIHLNTPVRAEDPAVPPPARVQQPSREHYSEATPVATAAQSNHFEIQPFAVGDAAVVEGVLSGMSTAEVTAFVRRFGKVAANEEGKFGIPAALTLGHGLLMSQGGAAAIAVQGNNFFRLRCTPDWQGLTLEADGNCYRHYETAWMSFRDHSLFITTGKFSSTRELRGQDYRRWIATLQKLGFYQRASDAKAVEAVIETLALGAGR